MGRGKNTKSLKDSKHRKETKEEKALRIQSIQQAREECLKLIPFALGAMFVLMVMFTIYVHYLPPRTILVPDPMPTSPVQTIDPTIMTETTTTTSNTADPIAFDATPKTEESETVEL